MPPLRFNEHLSKAQNTQISRVSDLVRGDDSGTIKFTYHHDSLPEPVVIHMIAHDCMSYPQNASFIAFSEFDNADNDFTRCLDAACQKQKWSTIEEAVRVISNAITSAIEKRDNTVSDDSGHSDDPAHSEDSPWDHGSDYEELDPLEVLSADNDCGDPFGQDDDDLVQPLDAKMFTYLRNSLRKAQSVGITVGIYPRAGSNMPKIVSLSAPATCLGVASGILESWGLRRSDNLVLLIKFDSVYPTLDEFLRLSSSQTALHFRFGRCLGEKPSPASVECAYRDPKDFLKNDDTGAAIDDNAQFPFEFINMSNPIDKLLNADFMRLLTTRRKHTLSWPHAQYIVSRLELQSTPSHSLGEEINVEVLMTQVDHIPWQQLSGLISQDGALDDPESFSLPLVAMQLALHRLANCTRYCMVCNSGLNQGYSALKPYVCSKPLCLFQYLSLGLGSSIEHEIINAPYVVDMLMCFLYAALAHATCRELPDGLSIKTAYVDERWAPGSYVAAVADMDARKIRDLDYTTLLNTDTGQPPKERFHEGERLVIVHREPTGANMDVVIKTWCRLTAFVDGEWKFEEYHSSQSKKERKGSAGGSTPVRLASSSTRRDQWRSVQLFGYWHSIDGYTPERRRRALLTIIDGLPSVLDMRKYLMDRPGRRLATWDRIHKSELAVLHWTVASNRSLIVQDDTVWDVETPPNSNETAWNKIGNSNTATMPWMQFRFLQGSPEMEQKFEHKASQLLEVTQTPTIFAWHGSRLKNWHSIIRTGLDFTVIENGRACGNGVYLSHEMNTSVFYSGSGSLCREDQSNKVTHWSKSHLQISSAIAVCELINCPNEFVSTSPHYVLDKLDWIQCRYLLVSINPSAEATQYPFYEPQSNETPAYVLQDANFPIHAYNEAVQIPITAIPFDRRTFQITKSVQMPAATAKVSSTEGATPLRSRYDADDVELYLGVDGAHSRLHSHSMKRRGSSISTNSSGRSQGSNKRTKATRETSSLSGSQVVLDRPRDTSSFDRQGLKMETLRILEAPTWASTSKQAVRRLTMDLKDLHRRQSTEGDLSSGFYVHTDKSDNMFQWIVELFNFDAALPLARDMQELGCASVVMELRFGPNYPIAPPFVRVIRPRLVPFAQGGGGHVTAGGAVCLELLTNSGWNPAIHIENVIMQIRATIGEPDPPARIDRGFVGADYAVGEAVAAFTRLARAHGWAVPEDFQHIAAL